MANNLHAIIFHLLLSLTFTTTIVTQLPPTTKPGRLVTRLVHRDSLSYDPNDSVDVRAERLINSSIARFIYLSEKAFETRFVQPNLFVGGEVNLFYVNFSIGQPPVPQLAAMDTGSSLIWVKCDRSCTSCDPVLDPSKSSTFATLPCTYSFCRCSSTEDNCSYNIRYVEGPDSVGIMATDRFHFETSDEGRTTINNVVFGCGLTYKTLDDKSTGVFGLGVEESGKEILSIVRLLGSRFSYCVGNINDYQYKFNRLVIGEGAVIEGYSTPLEISNGLYFVSLEGISIGEKRLDIDSYVFERTGNDDGVFIDSGSTMTWLAPTAYDEVRREIENLCKGLLTRYMSESMEGHLCYFGEIGRDLEGFPVMTFHFAEEADLVLDIWSMFLQIKSHVFCLAIASNYNIVGVSKRVSVDRSLIGIMAQQNYNMAYDLADNRLYFQRIDCQLLDD